MLSSDITIKSELVEDWRIIQPILLMLVVILVIYGIAVILRNIKRMYKQSQETHEDDDPEED